MTISDRRGLGLFDFQVNGFGGVDFQGDDLTLEQLQRAVSALLRHGTQRIFATLITDHVDRLEARFRRFEQWCAADPNVASVIVGYHLEGPWLSPVPGFSGAHPSERMHAPNAGEFRRLQEAASGRIRLVTLAPEWLGSPEFIADLVASGVHVALGHTNASEHEIDAAIQAGARFCTHLGNGTPLHLERHDNIIQRLLARDELVACFIPDGIHLPPFVLRNLVRAKPPGKVLFTTDAMAGAGMPPGTYTIGAHRVDVGDDGVARQLGGGGFAGSTLTPDEGVGRIGRYLGYTPEEAVRLWSEEPMRAFGVAAR